MKPWQCGLAIAWLVCTSVGWASEVERHEAAPTADQRPAEARVGIGFLWTVQSQQVVHRLHAPWDFVDVILSPGKLGIFEQVKAPVRVACIALALETHEGRPLPGLKETIETLRKHAIAPERVILAYNPERQPGTPGAEVDDLVGSVRRASEMAREYGAPLLVGPGLKEMMQREQLYPELARHCDIWLIQSQRLQLDATTRKPVDPASYRIKVKRIVDSLREGNPAIRIIVQVVTTAERSRTVLTAEQIAAFVLAIEDLVNAVRIYGASGDLLGQVIDRLDESARQREAAHADD